MALPSNYDTLNDLFDWKQGAGVLFPYFPMDLGQAASNLAYIDFDGTASAVHARISFPMRVRLVTCEAVSVSDATAIKGGACTTAEPIIGITYGVAPLASMAHANATEIGLITCDGAGVIGKRWKGTTTPTTISTTHEVVVWLKTAAEHNAASANMDGGCVPILWFAVVNAPA